MNLIQLPYHIKAWILLFRRQILGRPLMESVFLGLMILWWKIIPILIFKLNILRVHIGLACQKFGAALFMIGKDIIFVLGMAINVGKEASKYMINQQKLVFYFLPLVHWNSLQTGHILYYVQVVLINFAITATH
jgi:hypothetical protein